MGQNPRSLYKKQGGRKWAVIQSSCIQVGAKNRFTVVRKKNNSINKTRINCFMNSQL